MSEPDNQLPSQRITSERRVRPDLIHIPCPETVRFPYSRLSMTHVLRRSKPHALYCFDSTPSSEADEPALSRVGKRVVYPKLLCLGTTVELR